MFFIAFILDPIAIQIIGTVLKVKYSKIQHPSSILVEF